MKTRRWSALFGFVAVTLILSTPTAQAAAVPRVGLLPQVSVVSARLMLSDLLPSAASPSLRALAAEISLGASPQPGSIRILEKVFVEQAIGGSEQVSAEVAVPERISVSRSARPVTLEEVFPVVRDALKATDARAANSLQFTDLFLESQVLVGSGDSGLRVINTESDPQLRRARFKVQASRDPEVLPFFVTAHLTEELGAKAGPDAGKSTPAKANPSGTTVSAHAGDPDDRHEILVARGERATLVLHSNALQMFVDVVSLEAGALGQQIHVRTADGGAVLNATVDGRSHLSRNF